MLPEDDAAAALYEATAEEAARFGLRPTRCRTTRGRASESRHNLAYWRYRDYAGIGPGAHGRVSAGRRTAGDAAASRAGDMGRSAWSARATGATQEKAAAAERAREMLLMGLRLTEGVEAARFAARTGVALRDALDAEVLERAVEAGYVQQDGGRAVVAFSGAEAARRVAGGVGAVSYSAASVKPPDWRRHSRA